MVRPAKLFADKPEVDVTTAVVGGFCNPFAQLADCLGKLTVI